MLSTLDVQALRSERRARSWSQAELAERAGVSRAEVSAVETGRTVPSTVVALSLSRALDLPVEALFRLAGDEGPTPEWAWAPASGSRFWEAELFGRVARFPVEAGLAGALPHDGVAPAPDGAGNGGSGVRGPARDPENTLVLAGCDPTVGLLAGQLGASGVRLLPFTRDSRTALEQLAARRVHAAGIHLGASVEANRRHVDEVLGPGYRLAHVTLWTAGIALAPGLGVSSADAALDRGLRWIGRPEGSGAGACMDELLAGRKRPRGSRRLASDHRGVVEAIRAGWAKAGVCVQLVAEEGGVDFLPVRVESYDLCFAAELEEDPRIRALLTVLRSAAHRTTLDELPGFDARRGGAVG